MKNFDENLIKMTSGLSLFPNFARSEKYPFTNFVPSEIYPDNRPTNIIPMICLFKGGSSPKFELFIKCIVVAYRENWCDYPANSLEYEKFKIGNRMMNKPGDHFNYFVNTVDDSIVIVDFKRHGLKDDEILDFSHWLKHYWYKEVF